VNPAALAFPLVASVDCIGKDVAAGVAHQQPVCAAKGFRGL
jgi:hypothetical protein